MITKETIEQQIIDLEKEQTQLRMLNDQMVEEHDIREQAFRKTVQANHLRFQQLIGSIATLKQLLNGKEPPPKT